MNSIYINDVRKVADSIKRFLPRSYSDSISWAKKTAAGLIMHKAHYEMERCTIPVKFNDTLWNTTPEAIANRDPEWNFAFARHSILLNLAKAFAYTEDKIYKDRFIEIIESFLKYSDKDGLSWRSLEAGIRAENWIRSIEIFNEMESPLPEYAIDDINNSLNEHKTLLLDTHRSFQRLSNWGIIQEHGLFIIGLYQYDRDTIDIALKRLEEEAVFQIFGDGTHWEQSPLYHTEILHSLLDTILLARRNRISIPSILEEKARKASFELYSTIASDNHIFLQGDSDWIEADDLIYTAKKLFPELEISANKEEENYWDFGAVPEPRQEPSKKKSIYLEDSCNAYFRGQEIEAHMYFGNMGSGHGHVSPLHVDIYSQGKAFIIDSGRYTYTDSEMRYELKSLYAHNTIIIDDTMPEKPKDSWSYTSIPLTIAGKAILRKDFDYTEATNLSYLDRNTAIRRKLIRLGDGIIITFDEIISKGSHRATSLWHIAPDVVATINKSYIDIEKEDSKLSIWTNADNIELQDSCISRYYNEIENNKALALASDTRGIATIATVFSSREIDVEELEITLLDSGRVLDANEGLALKITTSDNNWTILTRAKEIVSQVDIMKAGELEGYGMTLIKHDKWKYPERIM